MLSVNEYGEIVEDKNVDETDVFNFLLDLEEANLSEKDVLNNKENEKKTKKCK